MSIYQENGYESRMQYFETLGEDHGVPYEVVCGIAAVLGRNEDFDGLVTHVENAALNF